MEGNYGGRFLQSVEECDSSCFGGEQVCGFLSSVLRCEEGGHVVVHSGVEDFEVSGFGSWSEWFREEIVNCEEGCMGECLSPVLVVLFGSQFLDEVGMEFARKEGGGFFLGFEGDCLEE